MVQSRRCMLFNNRINPPRTFLRVSWCSFVGHLSFVFGVLVLRQGNLAGVARGTFGGQMGVKWGSIGGRFGVDLGSFWGRFGERLGRFLSPIPNPCRTQPYLPKMFMFNAVRRPRAIQRFLHDMAMPQSQPWQLTTGNFLFPFVTLPFALGASPYFDASFIFNRSSSTADRRMPPETM